MLILLRKLRNQMLQKNRVITYLLYGIGEILLVVVGILIAVQIDGWNQNNKNQKKTSALLTDYYEDLAKDTVFFTERIKILVEQIDHGQKLLNRMRSPVANLDTIKNIARYEHSARVYSSATFNTNTFNSMVATGALELLRPEIKSKILELDKKQKESSIDQMIDHYFALIRTYNTKYHFGDKNGSNYVAEVVWEIKDEKDFVTKYLSMSGFRLFLLSTLKASYEGLLISTRGLMEDLKRDFQIDFNQSHPKETLK